MAGASCLVPPCLARARRRHLQPLLSPPPRPALPPGSHLRIKGVAAYQYTLHPAAASACNASAFEAWKGETGFDEGAYQGAGAVQVGQGEVFSWLGRVTGCSQACPPELSRRRRRRPIPPASPHPAAHSRHG